MVHMGGGKINLVCCYCSCFHLVLTDTLSGGISIIKQDGNAENELSVQKHP